MTVILVIMYAFYFMLVGVKGNAPTFLGMVGTEKQFLYWALVLMIVAALWQSPVAEPLAKALVFLIVIGFLLVNGNGQRLATNFHALLYGGNTVGA